MNLSFHYLIQQPKTEIWLFQLNQRIFQIGRAYTFYGRQAPTYNLKSIYFISLIY